MLELIDKPGNWIKASTYIASGKCPFDLRWLLFQRKLEMLSAGCVIQVGKNIFVDHNRLMLFLEELSQRNEGFVPKR